MSKEMAQEILKFVSETFPAQVKPEDLKMTTPLFSSQMIDSLGMVELLAFMEQKFRVTLTMTMGELKKLDTAAQLASYIQHYQQTRESP